MLRNVTVPRKSQICKRFKHTKLRSKSASNSLRSFFVLVSCYMSVKWSKRNPKTFFLVVTTIYWWCSYTRFTISRDLVKWNTSNSGIGFLQLWNWKPKVCIISLEGKGLQCNEHLISTLYKHNCSHLVWKSLPIQICHFFFFFFRYRFDPLASTFMPQRLTFMFP